MKPLKVTLDTNEIPAYGLPFPIKFDVTGASPTSIVGFNIESNTAQKQILIPPFATKCVIGTSGDVYISPISFSLPGSGAVVYNYPAVLNYSPLFEVDLSQSATPIYSLYLRTPVPTGVFGSVAFFA